MRKFIKSITLLASLLLAIAFVGNVSAKEAVTYAGNIRKIMKKHCVACHNPNRASAGLDLSNYAAIMRGSDSGEVVVAGDPTDSFLYLVTAHEEEPIMPQGNKKIPDDQVLTIRQWIEAGLPENEANLANMTPNRMSADPKDPTAETPTATKESPARLDVGPVFQGIRGTANRALAASRPKQLVAIGGQMQVLLFDASNYTLVGVLPFPEGEPQVLRFSADGGQLLAGGGVHAQHGRVVLWDTSTGQRVWAGGDEYDVVMAADLSADGKHIVLGGPERVLKMLNTDSGEMVHRIEKHTDWVLTARFGPDGLIFATADRDGGVYVWETITGELIHSLRGHKGAVHSIEFLPNKDVCRTASEDGTVRTWDLHSGNQLASTMLHPEGILGISALSPGSQVSIGRDMICKVTGDSQTDITKTLPSLPTNVSKIDDHRCVVSQQDGTVSVWDFKNDQLVNLSVPAHLLTKNISDVIPAGFVFAERQSPQPPVETMLTDSHNSVTAVGEADIDSSLLTQVTSLEQRLRKATQKLPAMVEQAEALRSRIGVLEAERIEIESHLQEKIAALETAEAELQIMMSELGQMFDVSE